MSPITISPWSVSDEEEKYDDKEDSCLSLLCGLPLGRHRRVVLGSRSGIVVAIEGGRCSRGLTLFKAVALRLGGTLGARLIFEQLARKPKLRRCLGTSLI